MHNFTSDDSLTEQQQQSLLDDLEVRCQTNVAAIREAASVRTRVRVELRSANACDRETLLAEVQTSEISSATLTGIATTPVMVGSVYHLRFDRQTLDVTPALAVCDRCTMLSDAAFDLRFRFTQPIDVTAY